MRKIILVLGIIGIVLAFAQVVEAQDEDDQLVGVIREREIARNVGSNYALISDGGYVRFSYEDVYYNPRNIYLYIDGSNITLNNGERVDIVDVEEYEAGTLVGTGFSFARSEFDSNGFMIVWSPFDVDEGHELTNIRLYVVESVFTINGEPLESGEVLQTQTSLYFRLGSNVWVVDMMEVIRNLGDEDQEEVIDYLEDSNE